MKKYYLKLLVYKTMVLTYGTETLVLTKRHSDPAFETRVLRRIIGPVCGSCEVKGRKLLKTIGLGRLRWPGHLTPMSQEEPARKVPVNFIVEAF